MVPFLVLLVLTHNVAINAYTTIDDASLSSTMWFTEPSLFSVLVDVRTQDEWNEVRHLPNATLIDSLHITNDTSLLTGCEECSIAVYCRSGRRSKIAAEVLESVGFKHVYDVLGVSQWTEEAGVDLVYTPSRNPDCSNHCPTVIDESLLGYNDINILFESENIIDQEYNIEVSREGSDEHGTSMSIVRSTTSAIMSMVSSTLMIWII